jgi:transcriptional regulator with XRE-family HTH domain
VDEAPFTGDLEFDAVMTRGQLAAQLRIVHLRADRPSLRVLAARTRHEVVPLSRTAVSDMLGGARFPRKAVMVAFLRACGLSDTQIEPWRRAWERIATSDGGQARVAVGQRDPMIQPEAMKGSSGPRSETHLPPGPTGDGDDHDDAAVASHPQSSASVARFSSTDIRTVRSPVVRRRELGNALRVLRIARGLTIEEVSAQLLCSASKVSRMETGHGVALRDIRDLCDLYGVIDEEERGRLTELALQGKQQGWWQAYDLNYGTYIGLEAEAASIHDFQSTLIPGLLQTEAYARAVLERGNVNPAPEWVQKYVDARITRQEILAQGHRLRFHSIVDEAALRRECGGREVMREQLERLAEAAELPRVTVQVLPFAIGAHPAAEDCFSILGFAGSLPDIVYVEGTSAIERFREAFAFLQDLALDSAESYALIKQIAGSMAP